jgi:hypothetical protein
MTPTGTGDIDIVREELKWLLVSNALHFLGNGRGVGLSDVVISTPDAREKLIALGQDVRDLSDDSKTVQYVIGLLKEAQEDGLIPKKYRLQPPSTLHPRRRRRP